MRTITVTGTKRALAALARAVDATVTEHARTGQPVVMLSVADASPVMSADARADGSVMALLLEDGQEHFHTYEAVSPFLAACRAWTPERGEQAMALNSAERCRRLRAEIENDRRIQWTA